MMEENVSSVRPGWNKDAFSSSSLHSKRRRLFTTVAGVLEKEQFNQAVAASQPAESEA
jgi:hypothetical protein